MPIAFALYRVGVDPARLAADPASMRLMVLATRQAFTALRANGNDEIPTNLRILYRLPTRVVIGYWRRVLNSPRGELWFGAHSRAAPEEMRDLADQLQEALLHTGRPTPDLDRLLATAPLIGTEPVRRNTVGATHDSGTRVIWAQRATSEHVRAVRRPVPAEGRRCGGDCAGGVLGDAGGAVQVRQRYAAEVDRA